MGKEQVHIKGLVNDIDVMGRVGVWCSLSFPLTHLSFSRLSTLLIRDLLNICKQKQQNQNRVNMKTGGKVLVTLARIPP